MIGRAIERRGASPAALLLLALAAAASASASRVAPAGAPIGAAGADAPWFCHDLDCPRYTVAENLTDLGVELRRYPAAKWASTVVEGVGYDKAVATAFWRLFKYISGANMPSVKVEMAAPVTVRVAAGKGPACKNSFTVSFFIPFAHQASPPAPSDEAVFIESRPALDVYVSSFGGWARGSTYLSRAADAADALRGAGVEIDEAFFFTAGYDSPFRLSGRHNEVWLPARKPAAGAGGAAAAALAAS